jgi:hypothetical protein
LKPSRFDQAQREWLAGLRFRLDLVGEQALKIPPVGQPGQIICQRDPHRRLPRLLGDALLLCDHETRAYDLGEHAKVLVEHANDKAGSDGDHGRKAERQVRPAGQECDNERSRRGHDDNACLARQHVETERENRGDDPDRHERQRELPNAVPPCRDRCHHREGERHRWSEHARRANFAADEVERLKLDTGPRLEPGYESKDGYADEGRGQKDPVDQRAGRRSHAEQRHGRENYDPMDIGAKPRQRAILLAQQRRIEGRLADVASWATTP